MLSDQNLLSILAQSQDATAVYDSANLHLRFANQAMFDFFGRGSEIIGQKLEDAIPELKSQPFLEILKNVWKTGVTYADTDTPATLVVDGDLKTTYFDFEYRAIKDASGKVISILHTATDVSASVLAR